MEVPQTDARPFLPGTLKSRLGLFVLVAFTASLIGVVVQQILRAPRRVDVATLPADEASIFSYLDNLYSAGFTEFPLRGLQAARHLPLNVARGVALAPKSISIGLRRFDELRADSKRNFGHLLCAGGDPEQVEEFCRRIERGEIEDASVVAFTHWTRLLLERRIPLRATWVDALVSRKWSEGQAYEIAFNLKAIVSYPGWPEYGRSDTAGDWVRSWTEFKAWWSSHRTLLEALPGEPLRVKP
jgi:hypothetical protein